MEEVGASFLEQNVSHLSRKMNPNFHGFLLCAVISLGALSLTAETHLELAVPFTDDMVLQRGKAVPVWGFDQPGSEVTVEFAGQRKVAVADSHGDWMVKLNPLAASWEERELL